MTDPTDTEPIKPTGDQPKELDCLALDLLTSQWPGLQDWWLEDPGV